MNSGDRECSALKASKGAILGSNQITICSNRMSAGTRHLQSISLMEVSDWQGKILGTRETEPFPRYIS